MHRHLRHRLAGGIGARHAHRGDAIDGSKLSVVARPDGGDEQLKLGRWPLYYFAGDGGPGDFNGQASGGVWFLVKGDGTLAKSAA